MAYDRNDAEVNDFCRLLKSEAEASGYNLNPDVPFTEDLVAGLLTNEERYGYRACPCRLADGRREEDRDIICPCDYRDADLYEYDACYCGLYVSKRIMNGDKPLSPVPERRPAGGPYRTAGSGKDDGSFSLPLPVWCCRVCGYLCARENPPETCPICKADKDRFERFI